jgi:hypothetical protein
MPLYYRIVHAIWKDYEISRHDPGPYFSDFPSKTRRLEKFPLPSKSHLN